MYLPAVKESADQVLLHSEAAAIPHGSETVLIAEDELSVRSLAQRVLRGLGYTVLTASNGEEALRVAETYNGEIHLLLTDVVMPQMGGKPLATVLREKRPELKVLFSSGYTDNSIVHHGVLDSGLQFLQKPFTLDGLSRKVREVLDI